MRRSVRPRPASPIDGDFDPARWRRLAFAIVCVAICVRAIWAMAVPVVPVSDSVAYDTFASNLANGDGYGWRPESPTAYWPVGTSAMYALLYAMFGHVYWPIVFFNIVLGVGIVALSS